MGLNMTLEQSQAQSESVNAVTQSQINGYQNLQRAIRAFINEADNLTGVAYDSAKDYFSSVLLPLVKGCELYAEMLAKACASLPSNYQLAVDSKSWSEEQLQEYINNETTAINSLDAVIQGLANADISAEEKRESRKQTTELLRGHHANKRIYETILENLRTYSTTSVALFSECEEVETQLATGLSQAETSWDASTGTFTISSDLSWATFILTKYATKDLDLDQDELSFVTTMMSEYGFDVITAQQLLTVKKGIDLAFSDEKSYTQENRDYIFLRVIGAANYEGFQWNETAGYLSSYFYTKTVDPVTGVTRNEGKSLLEIFQELGLREQEAKELNYNLRLQHILASGGNTVKEMKDNDSQSGESTYDSAKSNYERIYGSSGKFDDFWDTRLNSFSNRGKGHPDFTHQSITMATHLNPAWVQLSDIYGGRKHVKDLSGWEGDTTKNANDMSPSIGEDDYQSDLDAVNIVGRMKKGKSYKEAMVEYYQDIHQSESVREKEFLKNEDWDKVKDTIYQSLVPYTIQQRGEDASRRYISDKFGDVSTFIERIEAVANPETRK